jgi:hypothetical protein
LPNCTLRAAARNSVTEWPFIEASDLADLRGAWGFLDPFAPGGPVCAKGPTRGRQPGADLALQGDDVMEIIRNNFALIVPFLAAAVMAVSSAWALEPARDGYFHTGEGIRYKKVAIVNVKVYAIKHAMKQLPAQKSKQAVIDIDTDKRIKLTMLRDVDAEKIQGALRDGYAMNGYGDAAKINSFVGAMNRELKEGSSVTITYSSATKSTSISVEGAGSASVAGEDFMRATWSLWFGKIDQPALGDAMISRI